MNNFYKQVQNDISSLNLVLWLNERKNIVYVTTIVQSKNLTSNDFAFSASNQYIAKYDQIAVDSNTLPSQYKRKIGC